MARVWKLVLDAMTSYTISATITWWKWPKALEKWNDGVTNRNANYHSGKMIVYHEKNTDIIISMWRD